MEFDQLVTTGCFQSTAASLSGKWFAESLQHAVRWGELFEKWDGIPHDKFVEIEVSSELADQFLPTGFRDNTGRARYATLAQLSGVKPKEVRPVGKGGRNVLPKSKSFRCDVRFDTDVEWPSRGWTLGIRPIKFFRHKAGRFHFAEVKFLAEMPPEGFLRSGNRFQLLDGLKVIAHGMIASQEATPPRQVRQFESRLLC